MEEDPIAELLKPEDKWQNVSIKKPVTFTKAAEWKPGQIWYKNRFITSFSEDVLVNSVALVTTSYDTLAQEKIMEKFQFANIYEHLAWQIPDYKPGSIKIFSSPRGAFKVANIYTQVFAGPPQIEECDSVMHRQRYFIKGLLQAYRIDQIKNYIGMAFGMEHLQSKYHEIMQKIAAKHPQIKTVMYIGEFIDFVARRKMRNKVKHQPDYETYKQKLISQDPSLKDILD